MNPSPIKDSKKLGVFLGHSIIGLYIYFLDSCLFTLLNGFRQGDLSLSRA